MKEVVPEHHIQKRLYNRLVGAEKLRYSELKPKELEANLFMYHLKELIKMGLVEKVYDGYALTHKGKTLATKFSIREQAIRPMPSAISVIVLTARDGQYLLYKRLRQPYIDTLGFPSGKIHLGDSLINAAYRELDEKCGYVSDDIKLAYRGVFNLVENNEEGLKNHIIGHVWSGAVTDKKVFSNHAGETFWSDWKKEDYSQFIPGFKEIIRALQSKEFFGLDLRF